MQWVCERVQVAQLFQCCHSEWMRHVLSLHFCHIQNDVNVRFCPRWGIYVCICLCWHPWTFWDYFCQNSELNMIFCPSIKKCFNPLFQQPVFYFPWSSLSLQAPAAAQPHPGFLPAGQPAQHGVRVHPHLRDLRAGAGRGRLPLHGLRLTGDLRLLGRRGRGIFRCRGVGGNREGHHIGNLQFSPVEDFLCSFPHTSPVLLFWKDSNQPISVGRRPRHYKQVWGSGGRRSPPWPLIFHRIWFLQVYFSFTVRQTFQPATILFRTSNVQYFPVHVSDFTSHHFSPHPHTCKHNCSVLKGRPGESGSVWEALGSWVWLVLRSRPVRRVLFLFEHKRLWSDPVLIRAGLRKWCGARTAPSVTYLM